MATGSFFHELPRPARMEIGGWNLAGFPEAGIRRAELDKTPREIRLAELVLQLFRSVLSRRRLPQSYFFRLMSQSMSEWMLRPMFVML